MKHVLNGIDGLLLMLTFHSFDLLVWTLVSEIVKEFLDLIHCLESVEIVLLEVFWLLKLSCSNLEQGLIDLTDFQHSLFRIKKFEVPNFILHVIESLLNLLETLVFKRSLVIRR